MKIQFLKDDAVYALKKYVKYSKKYYNDSNSDWIRDITNNEIIDLYENLETEEKAKDFFNNAEFIEEVKKKNATIIMANEKK